MAKTLEQINQEFFDSVSAKQPQRSRQPEQPGSVVPDESGIDQLIGLRVKPDAARARSERETSRPVRAKVLPEPPVLSKTEERGARLPVNLTEIPLPKRKNKAAARLMDVLFYGAIIFILITTLIFSGNSKDRLRLFGYSGFTVISGSMQSEIPQGALVITQKCGPNQIMIGDNITFVRRDKAIVTHRVVDIYENYEGSGARGFQTWGIENPSYDEEIVYADNVIGVVKLSVPELGFILSYISDNITAIILFFGVLSVMMVVIKRLLVEAKKEEQQQVPFAFKG